MNVDGRGYGKVEFGDGIVTGMGTFQKYYTQAELEYLETQTGVEAIPATLGVYYLFRDETLQQQVLARRYRRAPAEPRKTFSANKVRRAPGHAGVLSVTGSDVRPLGEGPCQPRRRPSQSPSKSTTAAENDPSSSHGSGETSSVVASSGAIAEVRRQEGNGTPRICSSEL